MDHIKHIQQLMADAGNLVDSARLSVEGLREKWAGDKKTFSPEFVAEIEADLALLDAGVSDLEHKFAERFGVSPTPPSVRGR